MTRHGHAGKMPLAWSASLGPEADGDHASRICPGVSPGNAGGTVNRHGPASKAASSGAAFFSGHSFRGMTMLTG